MKISPELWQQIDPLLGAALDMDEGHRDAWLRNLDDTHPQLTPLLRKMLASHERAERSQELETVPKLAPPPPAASIFSSGTRIGPFELRRPLGRGGMGEVWLAKQADGRIERELALKLPTVYEHSDVWRERFRRERDILAKLTHPNIAQLFDAGVSEETGSRGQPYLAMEYVEGDSLTDFVAARRSTIAERLKLFQQILAAVAHAHRHLVVHRDLKPANILIDKSGQVKLLDFGIAKLIDAGGDIDAADLTRLGGRVMTLRYAAPEQVAEGVISTATDVYALGVILHELLTGLSPYRAVREQKLFTDVALMSAETAVPSSLTLSAAAALERRTASGKQLGRLIAGDLDAIILKAMRRNPLDRYTSIDQFDDDIRRHLENRPVKARAGTWRYLAGRFAVRNKLPLATATAVLITMAAGLVLVEQQRRVAIAEKARAEKHFASVRKLANTFIFDVNSEIAGLAGSLKAREMLVKTSLQYLDSLANEASDDPALRAELAAAYGKIANIQGSVGAANLGMLADSLKNFENAKKLYATLGNYHADDIALQRAHWVLRYELARRYAQNGDARWQENIAAAVTLAEQVAALKGADEKDRSKVATSIAEQAHLTSILIGQSAKVEASIDKAISMLEALLLESPGSRVLREELAAAYLRAADIYSGNQYTAQSLAHAIDVRKKSIAIFSTLAAEYPDQQKYPISLAFNQAGLADDLERASRFAEAKQAILAALQLQQALVANEPKNAYNRTKVLPIMASLARISYRQGDDKGAIRAGYEGLAFFDAMPAELKSAREERAARSDIQAFLGLALMNDADKTPRLNRATALKAACAQLAESNATLQEIRDKLIGAIDEVDAKARADGLASCLAKQAALAKN